MKVPWEQFDRFCSYSCGSGAGSRAGGDGAVGKRSGWLTKRGSKRKNWLANTIA